MTNRWGLGAGIQVAQTEGRARAPGARLWFQQFEPDDVAGGEIVDGFTRPLENPANGQVAIGIDPDKEYLDRFDRPIKLVDEGQVIEDLLG